MQNLKKILFFLSPQEKKRGVLLLFMIIAMGLIDMLGVASILPFIAVASNPDFIETNFFLQNLFKLSSIYGLKTKQEFIFFLGFFSLFILIFSLSFKALTIYLQTLFIQMRVHSISKRFIKIYLYQPYSWILNRNSSELSKTILSEVNIIVSQGLSKILDLISSSIAALFIIILLIFVNVKVTITLMLIFGGSYLLIYNFFKKYIDRIGNERLISNKFRFKYISEVFGAAKEVKLIGLEGFFIKKFSKHSKVIAINQSKLKIISTIPRYLLEVITFGSILLSVIFISKMGNLTNYIPIVSIYIFAGYRLMPSLQTIYTTSASLKFSNATIYKAYKDLQNLKIHNLHDAEDFFSLEKNITLNQITYSYPGSSREALKNISITIPSKKTVALIGSTGSGKTTTVDIILGLLDPQIGTLEIDGEVITNKNKKSWQRCIGYVPQFIYLSDDTIASNIAFGVDTKNIDYEMVKKVSIIANLHEFVTDQLPNKYQTIIGERGVKLSGGERQRIGIARALYHDPKVLILDEATSALDNETEKAVMDAVNNLDKDKTIIIIAHRLNTIRNCDLIYKLEKGQIKGFGKYNQIIND